MTSKTRYFVIASLLVLAVGLGTGLLAYYTGYPAGVGARTRAPEDLRYVPGTASVVAFANVHAVMTSPLREKLRTMVAGRDRERQEFTRQTGINVETDIDHVVAAAMRRGPDAIGIDGLVIARGRFDVVKIEALMREHGGHVEEFKGRRLIVGDTSGDKRSASVGFLEPGLIAVGGTDAVRAAIASAEGAGITSNSDVMNLVADIDFGDAWAVGRPEALTASAGVTSGLASQLPAIQWFSANVTVDTGLRGMVRAQTRDDASATNLRDLVKGLLAFARLQAGSRPEIDSVLRSLDLGGTGTTVTLAFDVPSEVFDLAGRLLHQAVPEGRR